MVLELHGVAKSTCTRRVLTVLKELDVPYKLITVDWSAGETQTPSYLQNQPFGQVPYLVDGDFVLFESRAIARYIAAKHQKEKILFPPSSDVQKWAIFEQASSVEMADFDPSASGYAVEKVFKPLRGLKGDDAVAAAHLETLSKKLDGYERILSKHKYLAGDELTIADLFHLPYGSMLPEGLNPLLDEKRPHVFKWWKELTALPSWKAANEIQ